jgi:hypothetical protein
VFSARPYVRPRPRIEPALPIALAAASLAVLWPAAVRAESVVLLAPRGDDTIASARTQAQRVLEAALRGQGVTVLPARAASPAPGKERGACDALDCAAALVEAADADLAAAVAVSSAGEPPAPSTVFVTLVDRSGARFPGRARVDPGVEGDLARAVKDALLDARALQLLGPGPWLRIRGEPEGAEVVLNGKLVGTVPYRAPVESGRHTLEVRSGGHRAHVQTVDVPPSAARQVEVDIDLPPKVVDGHPDAEDPGLEPDAAEPPVGSGRPIVGPLILGGLGVAVIATDIALVLSSGCQRSDSRGTCLEHRSIQKAPALVIGGVGFAAIAGAALWYLLGGDPDSAERDTALRLTPDGAAWTLSF